MLNILNLILCLTIFLFFIWLFAYNFSSLLNQNFTTSNNLATLFNISESSTINVSNLNW